MHVSGIHLDRYIGTRSREAVSAVRLAGDRGGGRDREEGGGGLRCTERYV